MEKVFATLKKADAKQIMEEVQGRRESTLRPKAALNSGNSAQVSSSSSAASEAAEATPQQLSRAELQKTSKRGFLAKLFSAKQAV